MSDQLEKISNYLNSIQNQDKKNYIQEILDVFETGKELIAYHASCTDGAITAALLRHYEPDRAFVPLDYNVLKDDTLRPFICEQNWYAIVDLEPFNKNQMKLYIDHHRSVIGSLINASRIHFEVGMNGPSAAYVLYNALVGTNQIPEYLKELVDVSKVTDTASFAIDPPIEPISKEEKWFLDDFDKLCWFVEDATNIEDNFSLKKNNELVYGLEHKGTGYLLSDEYIASVNKQREKRKEADEFVQKLNITELMVIVNSPNNTFKQYVALKLGKMGAKVIAFFSQKENNVTISLRQSKLNTKQEIEYYRLDLLAKRFNNSGGGHAEASGSMANSLEEAQKVVIEWGKEKKLKISQNLYSV